MSRKLYTPEQIIGKLREAEVALSGAIPIAQNRTDSSTTQA